MQTTNRIAFIGQKNSGVTTAVNHFIANGFTLIPSSEIEVTVGKRYVVNRIYSTEQYTQLKKMGFIIVMIRSDRGVDSDLPYVGEPDWNVFNDNDFKTTCMTLNGWIR